MHVHPDVPLEENTREQLIMAFMRLQQKIRGCKTKVARVSFIASLSVAPTYFCRVEYPASSPDDTARLTTSVDGAQ